MSKLVIQCFENVYAVCEQEDKTMVQIPRYKLPLEAKEGDCILYINGFYQIDYGIPQKKKKSIRELMNSLFV